MISTAARRASIGASYAAQPMERDREMTNVDTRQVNRDSLFLLAQLRVGGRDAVHRVKVRNLSAGGMMAEGEVGVSRGELVSVELRNIGWVEGTVAWRQENRFGIAFLEEVDAKKARAPVSAGKEGVPRYARSASEEARAQDERLRKL